MTKRHACVHADDQVGEFKRICTESVIRDADHTLSIADLHAKVLDLVKDVTQIDGLEYDLPLQLLDAEGTLKCDCMHLMLTGSHPTADSGDFRFAALRRWITTQAEVHHVSAKDVATEIAIFRILASNGCVCIFMNICSGLCYAVL